MSDLLRKATEPDVHRGLEGVVVDETAISRIDGERGRLSYRGYAIEDLAHEASFEEVCYLLWHGELPDEAALSAFADDLRAERGVEPGVLETVRELADRDEDPMAALRTAASMLSAYDPEPDADPEDADALLRKGRRLTATLPTALAAFERCRRGEEPLSPREDLGHAANFRYMLTGEEPGAVAVETLDQALTLHADHGLNASTFTAVTVASTYADAYSAVTAAIGALSGPWHGGANEDVIEALLEIDEVASTPAEWARERIEAGERLPGFGHRVYDVIDPRAVILRERSEALADATGDRRWYEYTRDLEAVADEYGLDEKSIYPNVDLYSGSVYYQLDVPVDTYTPLFALSRVAGWIAHVREYVAQNRLIRPRAKYVGPGDREFVPLAER